MTFLPTHQFRWDYITWCYFYWSWLNPVKLHSNTDNALLMITKHIVEAIMELSIPWIQPWLLWPMLYFIKHLLFMTQFYIHRIQIKSYSQTTFFYIVVNTIFACLLLKIKNYHLIWGGGIQGLKCVSKPFLSSWHKYAYWYWVMTARTGYIIQTD